MQLASGEARPALRILCATDFSLASLQAFHHALGMALTRPSALTLLHVGPESRDAVPWDRFPSVHDTLVRWGRLAADSPRTAVEEELGITVRKFAMRDEDPGMGILDHLAQHPADLIVMATRPSVGLARLTHRWVTAQVLRTARCNMLLLPNDCRSLLDEASGAPRLRRLLLPLDHEPDPRDTIALVTDWLLPWCPERLQATTLHVGSGTAPECVLPRPQDIAWERRQLKGPVAPTILAQAQELDVDLVVMPTAAHNGWLQRLRDSTVERTLRWVGRPLLAIPDSGP